MHVLHVCAVRTPHSSCRSGFRTVGLEDTQDSVTCYFAVSQKLPPLNLPNVRISSKHTSDNLDLGDSVGVTENNTDLRRSGTLLGQLADLVNDLLGSGLQP